MSLTSEEWISAFAAELGVEAPDAVAVEDLLLVASVAAHASERTAAPISCYLAALAGISPGEAQRVAQQLSERIANEAST